MSSQLVYKPGRFGSAMCLRFDENLDANPLAQ